MSDTTLIHDPSTNVPDYAAEESARLALEYKNLEAEATDLLAEARKAPEIVEDEETAGWFTTLIKRFRDLDSRVEKVRVGEKLPHMRREDAVDSFFFRLRERLARRKKTDKPGGLDVLLARLNDYNQRRLAEEEARREAARREAERVEQAAREKAAAEQRAADEAAAAADRARKAKNIEAHQQVADQHQQAADTASADAEIARDKVIETRADATAKPADMVRERHQGGALNTMRQVWVVEIEDSMKLDPVALWAFVKDDHKLMALRSWAKTTNYKKPMDGALIEQRNETVVR